MTNRLSVSIILIAISLLSGSCTRQIGPDTDAVSCQIVYDAGSSRTRLYIYERTPSGWLAHRGPESDALADPVRGIRGKTMSDAGVVVENIVAALENIRRDGPLDSKGEPEWLAFDWPNHCTVDAAAVYATAGMRLAEQHDSEASELIWKMLNDGLNEKLLMPVSTRTLSGYEEGLFAWLAIREDVVDENFGLAEMGGASVQVTFPCADCESSKMVRVKDQLISIFSHSFLGLGQDEAWKKFGPVPSCERGVGLKHPDWQVGECATHMPVSSEAVTGIRGRIMKIRGFDWYLTGAFRYMRDIDIDQYCRQGLDSGYQQSTSCFRAVYLDSVLDALGVPESAEPTDVDWTLGAVICTATRCLE